MTPATKIAMPAAFIGRPLPVLLPAGVKGVPIKGFLP